MSVDRVGEQRGWNIIVLKLAAFSGEFVDSRRQDFVIVVSLPSGFADDTAF